MYQKRHKESQVISLYRGNYKAKLYLREISKLATLPLKTTQNTLKQLEKNKILISTKEGKNKYFSLNVQNIQTKLYLLQAEIYQTSMFLEKYPSFKLLLKYFTMNTPLIVFGSFARLKADKESDVDILVIAENEVLPTHLIPYTLHQIILAEPSFIKAIKKQETLIKEIEENHLILNNHSFYVNAMWEYYGK